MTLKLSKRTQRIPPFMVMEVLRAANEISATRDDIIRLEAGQPSTGAPRAVIEAAKAAMDSDKLGYTDALGTAALRARIARHYRDYYGLEIPERRIIVTMGASGAFLLAFTAAFDIGDRVALADPSYPGYRNILHALGVEPVILPSGPSTRFQPSVALLDDVAGPIDGLIVASPSNPTGTMLDGPMLAVLARACDERGIRLISDEIYHGITYQDDAVSVLSFSQDAIVINSFSKYFSMTGWRIGWMIVPEDMLRGVECVAQNMFISPSALAQSGAIAAFECRDELDANVARYARNRALLLDELPAARIDKFAPADGAFYIYADVSAFTDDSPEFCRRMLAETGIAATPGVDFDQTNGNSYIRLSFAGAVDDIRQVARRLGDWLK